MTEGWRSMHDVLRQAFEETSAELDRYRPRSILRSSDPAERLVRYPSLPPAGTPMRPAFVIGAEGLDSFVDVDRRAFLSGSWLADTDPFEETG